MAVQILTTHRIQIAGEADIGEVRHTVRGLAQGSTFDAFAVTAIVTAASELSRNIWHHAKRGEVLIETIEEAGRIGLRLTFRDSGPGIADIPRVLAGGYSTGSSMGLGLSGSRRLVDTFEITSALEQGTTIVITKWKRRG